MRTVDVLYGIPYFFLVVLINLVVGRTTGGLFVSIVVVLWLCVYLSLFLSLSLSLFIY